MTRVSVRRIAAAAAFPLFIPFAHAEDAVVVTASRFPESAARLPASVTVIDREDIARSPARTLPELLSERAGVAARDLYGNNGAGASVDLRGYGATASQNTLILVDGQRLSDIDLTSVQWSAIPLSSVERIEIVRGAGAVQYGDGASAGVINIITRSPLAKGITAEASLRMGSYSTVEGQLSAGYANGTFGINGSVYGYASDGYRANNRNEQQNQSLNLRWAGASTTLDVRAGTDKRDLRLPGARRVQPSSGLNEYLADPRGAQTPLDYASRDGGRAGATLSHRIGDVELTLGGDYRVKDQRAYFDQSGFPSSRDDNLEMRSLAPRARIPFSTGALRHVLTIGADWHSWRYDSRRSPRVENLGQPVNRVRVSRDNSAFHVQDAIEYGATQVVIGARGERASYEARDTLDRTAPGFAANTAAPAVDRTQRVHAWELGLRRAFSAQWSAFARAGRSFRLVNVDEIYETDAAFANQFQLLRPQRALTHEAGASWRSGRHALRATLFATDVTDEIHLDPFSTGVGNTNLPPSRRRGIELDGAWQAMPRLRLAGAYTFTDARFLQGTLPGSAFAIGTNLDITGKRVPLVPAHKLTVGLTWDATARTRLSGVVSAASSQVMDNDEPNTLGTRIPRYATADVKLSHELGWGRVALMVNNLFNDKSYSYAVRSAFTVDRYAVYPLAGRTIGASLEARLP